MNSVTYRIREIDPSGTKILLVCHSEAFPHGIPYTLETIKEDGHFPEGARLDQLIREVVNGEEFQTYARDWLSAAGAATAELATPFDHPVAPSGVPFISAGDEKIYLSRAVNTIRQFDIPVEIH